jgi:hypothetical protein
MKARLLQYRGKFLRGAPESSFDTFAQKKVLSSSSSLETSARLFLSQKLKHLKFARFHSSVVYFEKQYF